MFYIAYLPKDILCVIYGILDLKDFINLLLSNKYIKYQYEKIYKFDYKYLYHMIIDYRHQKIKSLRGGITLDNEEEIIHVGSVRCYLNNKCSSYPSKHCISIECKKYDYIQLLKSLNHVDLFTYEMDNRFKNLNYCKNKIKFDKFNSNTYGTLLNLDICYIICLVNNSIYYFTGDHNTHTKSCEILDIENKTLNFDIFKYCPELEFQYKKINRLTSFDNFVIIYSYYILHIKKIIKFYISLSQYDFKSYFMNDALKLASQCLNDPDPLEIYLLIKVFICNEFNIDYTLKDFNKNNFNTFLAD